jgi:hypothetical protein
VQQVEYFKKNNTIPKIGSNLGVSLSRVLPSAQSLWPSLTIERITYEESLKYRDIPEYLTDIKAKSKEKKHDKVHEDESSNGLDSVLKASRKPDDETKKSLDELFLQVLSLKQQQKETSAIAGLIPSSEVVKLLGLSHEDTTQFYKIEIQRETSTLVVLVRFNPTLSSR